MAETVSDGRGPVRDAPRRLPGPLPGHMPRQMALPRIRVGLDEMLLGVVSLVAARAAFARSADFDFWWHLAVGRFIAAERALPVPDPFSLTAAGRDWTAHEWLIGLAMYGLYRGFGMVGPLVAFAACFVVALWLVAATLRGLKLRAAPATLLLLLLLGACAPYLGPRPNVVSTLLLAVEVALLERWVRRRDRSIVALPLLLWAWANLHGSFVVGLGVATLLLGAELAAAAWRWDAARRLGARECRWLALAIGVGALLVPLNANELRLLWFPFSALGDPLLKQTQEWQPLDVADSSAIGFVLLLAFWLGLALVRRPRVPLSDIVLAGGLAAATLMSQRFQPFAAVLLTVAVGRMLVQPNRSGAHAPRAFAALARWRDDRAVRFAALGGAASVLNGAVLVAIAVAMFARDRPYDVRRDEQMPVAALEAVGAEGLRGPLFNEFGWGGYLIWTQWPQTRVFIDGRQHDLFARGPELGEYLEVVRLREGAARVLAERGFRTVLFVPDAPLTRYLLASGRWHATYEDAQAIVLVRNEP
ncbi:MAG: hypothetical protein EXR63_04995 [Dehalococcoidia bacterium]|nr:hypothetical protein [Dehalococcoidia bacterium]